MTTIFDNPAALLDAVGQHLGYSDWLEIDQQRINLFADATGDHQWIHVDPEKAAEGPFGSTIAHGYLTMSLTNFFLPTIVDVQGFDMGINYGLDKARFPAPVSVGDLTAGKKIALFAVPGASTPPCHQKHVPSVVVAASKAWFHAAKTPRTSAARAAKRARARVRCTGGTSGASIAPISARPTARWLSFCFCSHSLSRPSASICCLCCSSAGSATARKRTANHW